MTDVVNSYCRLCATLKSHNKLINLHLDGQKCAEIVMKLVRLNAASPDLFRDKILPMTVCYVCISSLDAAFDFILAIEQAQKVLNNILFSREIKNETLSDNDNRSVLDLGSDIDDTQNAIKQESDSKQRAINPEAESTKRVSKSLKKRKAKIENFSNNTNNLDNVPLSQMKLTWKDYIWTCSYCGTQFSNVNELNVHSLKYHQCCNAYRCVDCNIRKFRLDKFIIHVKKHRKHLKLSCYICFAEFSSSVLANRHKRVHLHSNHVCLGCNTSFPNCEELTKHNSKFNRENKKFRPYRDLQNQTDSLTCFLCHKTFKNKLYLNKHLLIHTERPRDHTCDKCGKCFFSKQNLIGHLLLHNDARPFQCVICNFGFKTKGQLRNHVGVHDGQKPFSCDQCGRCFRLQKHLTAHSIIHTDSLPYMCTFCNKSFRFKTILNQHIRQHTGVKPYSCSICQRAFTNWPNYNKHMKRLHGTDMSKKKHTPSGVFRVDPTTGEIIPNTLSDNAEEWKRQIISSVQKRPGRPKLNKDNKRVEPIVLPCTFMS